MTVYGLGGAGKTQLVLDYIQRRQKDYKSVYWVDARSQASVEQGLAVLYRILYRLPAVTEAVAFDELLIRIKAWFSGHCKYETPCLRLVMNIVLARNRSVIPFVPFEILGWTTRSSTCLVTSPVPIQNVHIPHVPET